jgi:hypothetical protein
MVGPDSWRALPYLEVSMLHRRAMRYGPPGVGPDRVPIDTELSTLHRHPTRCSVPGRGPYRLSEPFGSICAKKNGSNVRDKPKRRSQPQLFPHHNP